MPADRPCCPIGRRGDVGEIDAALRAGTPYRQVAIERGCPDLASAIYRHKAHMGDEDSTPASGRIASQPPSAHATVEVKQALKQPEASEAASLPTSEPLTTPQKPSARATQAARQLPVYAKGTESTGMVDVQRVTAERIRAIANLIAMGAWTGRKQIAGYAHRWAVPEDEVRRLYALAALRVKGDRGTMAAQRELSVARVTKIIEAEHVDADLYAEAAREAFKQAASAPRDKMSTAPAKLARLLASMARTTALRAEEYLGKITFQRPKDPTTLVNVSYSAHPDWAEATARQRIIVDTLEAIGATSGLSARIDEAFALWEQGGDAALEEWRREQIEAGSMLLTQGSDGAYSDEAVA